MDDRGSARALACGFQRPRWKHRRAEMDSTRASNPTAGGGCAPHGWNHSVWETVFGGTPKTATGTSRSPAKTQLVAVCKDPAKGSLGWTNGATELALRLALASLDNLHPRFVKLQSFQDGLLV